MHIVTGTLKQWRSSTEFLCGKNMRPSVIFMILVPVVLSFFSESLNILCKHRIFKRKNIS